MAKGNIAKNEIYAKLMEIFPDSFMYNGNKELRINLTEEGSPVQIKVALTCSKSVVTPDADDVFNSDTLKTEAPSGEFNWSDTEVVNTKNEISEQEKENIQKLVKVLGF